MKRVAIFASYSKNNIIPEYVIYYLRGLKKVASDIIFIADNEVQSGEEEKLKDLVIYSKCERHGCYDFGSYRRGFEWAETNGLLDDADELIFCNDSCYGPVFPFEKIFAEMEKKECDFWGMVESMEVKRHLQSYFLVFKKAVFESDVFKAFINSFEQQDSLEEYINRYELRLTEILVDAGFSYASRVEFSQYLSLNNGLPCNLTKYPVTSLKLGMPFIKCRVFKYGFETGLAESLEALLKLLEVMNPEIYCIITHDIPRLYDKVRETPTNICLETSSLVGKTMGLGKALQVFNAMSMQSKDNMRNQLQQQIMGLNEIINQKSLQINSFQENVREQQTIIKNQQDYIEQLSIIIRQLHQHIDEILPVYRNKYSMRTYQLISYNSIYEKFISLYLKFLSVFAKKKRLNKCGLSGMNDFSEERYMTAYPDVQGDALRHYIHEGIKEGRFLYTHGDMGMLKKQQTNDMPLVSIVVTSYNYAHLISETLDSLVRQTYKNIEIIVVDDGSKDNSVEVISEYVKKYDFIHLFTHPNHDNKGLPASMRLGIEKSKGEYVAFCESDDYLRNDYVQKKVDIINRYENVGIVSNAIKMFGNQKDIEARGWVCQHIRKLLKQGGTPVDMRYNQDFNFIPTLSSVMIKREILIDLDYNTPIPAWIDFWLYRQILINNVLYFVDEELTFWRQHESYNGLENSSKIYGRLAEFLEKSNRLLGL